MEELLGGALRTDDRGSFPWSAHQSLSAHIERRARQSGERIRERERPLGFSLSTLYIQVTAELYGLPRAPGGVGIALNSITYCEHTL